jgi:hypothetical protein
VEIGVGGGRAGDDGKAKVLMVEVTEVVMMEMTAKVSDGRGERRRWQQ